MTFFQKLQTITWILNHKINVLFYILKFCLALIKRGILHDNSKLTKEEFEYVYLLSTKGKNVKFGDKEYYDLVDSCKSAKNAHAKRNRHHPEFYSGNIYRMSPLDLVEMMADWQAATKRNKGNIQNSLKINKKKYKIKKSLENSIIRDMREVKTWSF
jgi:Family of unknown function (DUF5662)